MDKKSTYAVILETAYQMFAEYGFEKTSMAMIAKQLDISKPALYYHFPSKESIVDMLFEELCESIEFHKFFTRSEYTKENLEEKLIKDGLYMIMEQKTDPHYSRIMKQYQALGYRNPKYAERLVRILDQYAYGFDELLRLGNPPEAKAIQNTRILGQLLAMTVDSIDNFASYGLDYAYEEIWRSTVQAIVNGVRDGGSM
ncbi:TetR/AcrR family transcriptional regulator [Paenibacillus luteus]|uniref:TetR/AcrR family transcriptional regulator n=1 Tax=Paenibacillus luteus TaxID=2545753 RepID=UPI0011429726|nr:TetR/AcrR family transcriptional regulator [Paenibacillus luteus]